MDEKSVNQERRNLTRFDLRLRSILKKLQDGDRACTVVIDMACHPTGKH